MKYHDIEDSFYFVSSEQPDTNYAYISKTTGQTYFYSDLGSNVDELPDDIDNNDDYISVPHKNDLGLGHSLVWEFVEDEISEHKEKIRRFFSNPGAYLKFKYFLNEINYLDTWYEFENTKIKEALIKWCWENKIEIDD